jgi:hypothetical protein
VKRPAGAHGRPRLSGRPALPPRAWTVLVVGLLAACARDEGRVAGGGPYARFAARAVPQVERVTGLRFKRPPRIEARSKEQVRSFLERELADSAAVRELRGQEAAYKLLGLVPDTMDVRKFLVDLLTEQIAGYYDPRTKVLYVVQGAPEALTGLTVEHELVHALQDQYVNLDSIQKDRSDPDRSAAAQAVIEGQAMYEQVALAAGGEANIAARLPGGWAQMRDLIRENSGAAMPQFARAPFVIQEELIFPYLSGAEFVRRFRDRRPGKQPFDDMPTSTEQVLHERAYFETPRDGPTRLTLPPLRGATAQHEGDLGEFTTRLFLYEHLKDQNAAFRGAAGWGGDRYVVAQTPRGPGIVWVTVWDTPIDAAEFFGALQQVAERRYHAAAAGDAGGTEKTYRTAQRTVVVTTRAVAGRPVVLYVDVPAGANAAPLDLGRLVVERGR